MAVDRAYWVKPLIILKAFGISQNTGRTSMCQVHSQKAIKLISSRKKLEIIRGEELICRVSLTLD